jgi:hypothetical protein
VQLTQHSEWYSGARKPEQNQQLDEHVECIVVIMEDIVVRDVLTGVVHYVAGAARHYRERASWGWCGI